MVSRFAIILLLFLVVHPISGCTTISSSRTGLTSPPIERIPVSPIWVWNQAGSNPGDDPEPSGMNGVFIGRDLLLTTKHSLPIGMGRVGSDSECVRFSHVDSGGPFGGPASDWIIVRVDSPRERVIPRPARAGTTPGSAGFIVGYFLEHPDIDPLGPAVVRYRVVKPPSWASGYGKGAIPIAIEPEGFVGRGFSGSPAYTINLETGEPELVGILVGALGLQSGCRRVSEQIYLAPLDRRVIEILERNYDE